MTPTPASTPVASSYGRLNPFPAKLVENRLLSGKGSAKEVRHIVFELAGSGLAYRVGQSLGVYATNAAEDVAELLKAGGFNGSESVMLPKATAAATLQVALTKELFLASPTKKLLEALLSVNTDEAQKAKITALLAPEAAATLTQYLEERFFADILEEFSASRLSAQALVDCMKKLQPRLYSIASSPKVVGTKVELTVGIVRYTSNGRARKGTCSTFMAERLALGATAPVFVGESPFKITDTDTAPAIMVGPGTGIAPFRAFLQERSARKATGQNWLFFGDQHRSTDYLYETEFEAYKQQGLLTRLDLAWSRDGATKVYVQDLMRQNAAELWKWLEAGACFYVCGDAKRMAKDVEAALLEIIKTQGGRDEAQAAEYLSALKKAGRYMRDVY